MKSTEQVFGKLSAITTASAEKPRQALVLLHGVGSNEEDLLDVGTQVAPNRLVVSLRAPLILGLKAFAWFHAQFTPEGPVHQWDEAKAAFSTIEEAIRDVSAKSEIPLSDIAVLGFSQGAIMTIGLALHSKLPLARHIAVSGRTLPEFEERSLELSAAELAKRRVYLSHGIEDPVLPVKMGRHSEMVLRAASMDLTYKEYRGGHHIPADLISDLKRWLADEKASSGDCS